MSFKFGSWLTIVVGVLVLAGTMVPTYAQSDRAKDRCSVADDIPADAMVYHVTTYGGTSKLGAPIELDDTSHETKKLDVLVNLPGKPVLLVLTAYDPVVWNVAWTGGTRIVGAIVSGYHGQAILGIPRSIPLYLTTFVRRNVNKENRRFPGCPVMIERNNDVNNKLIVQISGLAVTQTIAAPMYGPAIVGEDTRSLNTMLQSSSDYQLNEFALRREMGELPAGRNGFEELAKRGMVRNASVADIRRFEKSGAKVICCIPTYVVVKPITLPTIGPRSINVLLEPGIPIPGGEKRNTYLYRYGEGKCYSPSC